MYIYVTINIYITSYISWFMHVRSFVTAAVEDSLTNDDNTGLYKSVDGILISH